MTHNIAEKIANATKNKNKMLEARIQALKYFYLHPDATGKDFCEVAQIKEKSHPDELLSRPDEITVPQIFILACPLNASVLFSNQCLYKKYAHFFFQN